ncbi:hypothetical protein CROQUDRAFT_97498 [Cronartium quercuum f. sp. fusiforme G11]|uniref:Uncharacterized protein n=1 Tax=Cronartium quercuum f. sp. fusiforme G11 TaxID=708437 RepID=A0A9P6NA92_9BASI|nr:hypothetical protein CROQUDRAFT_97498 [Cronartium quercuum f. sp. fusiforme G11]
MSDSDFFSTSINPLPPSTQNSGSEDEDGEQTIFNISHSLFPPTPSPSQPQPNTLAPSAQPVMQGTAKQLQAVYLNQALGRISPKNPLYDDNFFVWSFEIRNGLDSLYYAEYLESDDIKDEAESIVHEPKTLPTCSSACFAIELFEQVAVNAKGHQEKTLIDWIVYKKDPDDSSTRLIDLHINVQMYRMKKMKTLESASFEPSVRCAYQAFRLSVPILADKTRIHRPCFDGMTAWLFLAAG